MDDQQVQETKASLVAQLENPHLTEQEIKRIERKLEVLSKHG